MIFYLNEVNRFIASVAFCFVSPFVALLEITDLGTHAHVRTYVRMVSIPLRMCCSASTIKFICRFVPKLRLCQALISKTDITIFEI